MRAIVRILLWEPDQCAASQLQSVLVLTGCLVNTLSTPAALAAAAREDREAFVLASIDGVARAEVLAALADLPNPRRLLLLASTIDFATRRSAVRAGAAHLVAKPVDPMRLLPILERPPGEAESDPYVVLIVGDDALSNLYHATLLREAGLVAHLAGSGAEAIELAGSCEPDLLLSDYDLGDCTGMELLAMLRDDDRYAALRMIFLSGRPADSLSVEERAALGEDFIAKPVDPRAFVTTLLARAGHARHARRLAQELHLSQRAARNARLTLDTHAIVSVTNPDGEIIYVNDKFCRTTGYTREALLGRDHGLLRSGVHSDDYYDNMWETLRDNRVWQGELCNRAKDGSLYWVQATMTPILGVDGRPSQFVSVCTDISVQKEVESRLFALLNSANVGLAWVDMAGWILDVNDTFAAMTGYEREELLTMRADAFTHEWDEHNIPAQLATLATGAPTVRFQKRYLRKGGEGVWADVMLTRVDGPDGKMRGAVGSVIDISRQKAAEDRLRLVVRGSLDGLWDWSARTRHIYFSRRFRELLGFGQGEEAAFDAYFRLPQVIHPEDYGPARRALLSHLRRRGGGVFDVALRFLHRDGQYRWFRARGQGVWDERGAPERFAGSFTDLTELKRAEAELRAAKEAAEGASHAKTEFLSRLTHELRTPMNSILGFAQLLETDPAQRLAPSQLDNLAQIQKAGWHLLDLINEVLDLARIEAGRMEVVLEDFPVADILDDCLTLISLLATKHGVTVVNRLSDGFSPVVRADPMRLKQAVLNLLSNAVKYNRRGGLVYVDVAAVAGGWRLDVSDTGIGLTEPQLAGLFQPFTRFAEDGKREGSGIGLAITKRLLEAMGGTIQVTSQAGAGSVFSIILPGGQAGRVGRSAGVHRLLA